MTTQRPITKVTIAPGTLTRNQYCDYNQGESQIYNFIVYLEIGYQDYQIEIMSGYNLEARIFRAPKLDESSLQDLKTIHKFVQKCFNSVDQSRHSYLALDRNHQIRMVFDLIRKMDGAVEYEKFKPLIEQFAKLEDIAAGIAIRKRLQEETAREASKVADQ
jgi:hypothetical protein